MEKSGLVIIDKPAGWTSFMVVQNVKRTLDVKRAGHTGTLDPFATGVLPVCINKATKAIQFLQEDEKEYEGVFVLGLVTDTLDCTGSVQKTCPVPVIPRLVLEKVAAEFHGQIEQTVPYYSAVKFKGKPLYFWARRGVSVEKEPRSVLIKEFEILEFNPPEVWFKVTCSKGTYVRSLARDFGERLGCGASLKHLRRLRSGPFTIDRAVSPEMLRPENLCTFEEMLSYLPYLELDGSEARKVKQGQGISLRENSLQNRSAPFPWVRLMSENGELIAIYMRREHKQDLEPVRVFKTL